MAMNVTSDPNDKPAIQYKGLRTEVSQCIFARLKARDVGWHSADKTEIVMEAKRVIDVHLGRRT